VDLLRSLLASQRRIDRLHGNGGLLLVFLLQILLLLLLRLLLL
jgi:hypothetical protein